MRPLILYSSFHSPYNILYHPQYHNFQEVQSYLQGWPCASNRLQTKVGCCVGIMKVLQALKDFLGEINAKYTPPN